MSQNGQAERARAALLVDTVREARIAAEQGNWAKVKRLIATATEIAKDLPKQTNPLRGETRSDDAKENHNYQ